jgi:hypothetical protein
VAAPTSAAHCNSRHSPPTPQRLRRPDHPCHLVRRVTPPGSAALWPCARSIHVVACGSESDGKSNARATINHQSKGDVYGRWWHPWGSDSYASWQHRLTSSGGRLSTLGVKSNRATMRISKSHSGAATTLVSA